MRSPAVVLPRAVVFLEGSLPHLPTAFQPGPRGVSGRIAQNGITEKINVEDLLEHTGKSVSGIPLTRWGAMEESDHKLS